MIRRYTAVNINSGDKENSNVNVAPKFERFVAMYSMFLPCEKLRMRVQNTHTRYNNKFDFYF